MSASDLNSELSAIAGWDRERCCRQWLKLTGNVAGRHLSTHFLRKALAFELQCKALGGQSSAVKRQLRSVRSTQVRCSGEGSAKAAPALSPGNQLVREWNGRIYRVMVLDNGFELDNKHYRSLSAVARHITGAAWSGPRFFGLKKAS